MKVPLVRPPNSQILQCAKTVRVVVKEGIRRESRYGKDLIVPTGTEATLHFPEEDFPEEDGRFRLTDFSPPAKASNGDPFKQLTLEQEELGKLVSKDGSDLNLP